MAAGIVAFVTIAGWMATESWVAQTRRHATTALQETVSAAADVFSSYLVSNIGDDGVCRPVIESETAEDLLHRYARYAGLFALIWARTGADEPPAFPKDAVAAFAPLRLPPNRVCAGGLWAAIDPAHWRPLAARIRGWMAFCAVGLSALAVGTVAVRRWRERGSEHRQKAFRHAETVAAGVACLLLALIVNIYLAFGDRFERERWLSGLRRQALLTVGERAQAVELYLAALARFFENSDEVTREEFENFVAAFPRRVAADIVEWRPRVSVGDLPEFEADIGGILEADARSGWAADAETVYPRLYAAATVSETAIAPDGWEAENAASSGGIPRILEEAWRSRRALAAGPAADLGGKGEHLWFFQPVARRFHPAVWRWSAEGILAARVPLDALTARVAAHDSGEPLLDVRLEAVWLEAEAEPGAGADERGAFRFASAFSARRPLLAFGRLWGMRIEPAPAFVSLYPVRFHGVRFLVGLLTGLAITSSVGLARERGAQIERAVQARSAALKNRERQLRASEERYRQLFERMPDGFALHEMIFDCEGNPTDYRFLEVNPAFERLTGLRAVDLLGRTLLQSLPASEREWIPLFGEVVRTGTPLRMERYSVALQRYYNVYAYRTAPGKFATVFEDVTERKRMEEERRQLERKLLDSQRRESLGVLAGGIAHDFNNHLMAILGNAELAARALQRPEVAAMHLDEIRNATRRAADLCRQMLAYAGRGRFEARPVPLKPLIEETLRLLRPTVSSGADVSLNIDPAAPAALGDASQIRQVIMNLVLNAFESVGERVGTVEIAVRRVQGDARYFADALFAENPPDGDYVALEVADNGCGMDAATQARIFEPFFTTKFMGRGLGLPAVMGIIRSHRGALKLWSRPGRGARFTAIFPAAGAPADPKAPAEPRPA